MKWPNLIVKPCPNRVASRCKLTTWVSFLLYLARRWVHLHWLAMTCGHFGLDQICTQVKASFSLFCHPTQVNASWVTSINLLLANDIVCLTCLKMSFCDLHVLAGKLTSPFGHPTQVHLARALETAHLRTLLRSTLSNVKFLSFKQVRPSP